MKKPQNIYDNQVFFDEYNAMRNQEANANNLIEIPIIKSMLPELIGKDILDIGCGAGGMSRYFAEKGAKSVLALDISENMLNEARRLTPQNNVTYQNLAMEDLSSLKGQFDIVFSSLAFHYVEDFEKLCQDIAGLLRKGGQLIFSQEHPITTAPIFDSPRKAYLELDGRRYFIYSDYNNNSKRVVEWNHSNVEKYHRNFEVIVNALINAGLSIVELKESTASKDAIEKVEKYKYQKDRPYYLFIKAVKS